MASYAYTFTSGDTVTPTKLNNARTVSNIVNADISATADIAGSKLVDGAISNVQVNATAAIAGTKILPNFGSQDVVTTGQAAVGTAINANAKLNVGGTMPAQTTQRALAVAPAFDNNASAGAQAIITGTTTASNGGAAYTISSITHFLASQGTLHADSTVTNQYGLFVSSSLTGATNNYGVFSQIADAANRWNVYVSGTAPNYFAGNVGIATTSPSEKLQVTGNIKASGFVESDTSFRGQASDTASAPSFSWADDSNTGMFRPAADTIAFSEGGVEAMRITSAGNVGIGTTSPTTKLSVTGDVNTTEQYFVDGVQVVSNRVTGWGAPTGTISRSALTLTAAATYSQSEMNTVLQSLKAVITDLRTHGLMGN
jgi:hypothetical protein